MSKNLEYFIIEKAALMNDGISDKKAAENFYRKLLGVLNEEGPYAFTLFLHTYFEKGKEGPIAKSVSANIFAFLEETAELTKLETPGSRQRSKGQIEELKGCCRKAAEDIHNLFFLKEILEKIMSYALYDVRA